MVQAYEQYAFLYEVLKKMWEEKYCTPVAAGDHKAALIMKQAYGPLLKDLEDEKVQKAKFYRDGKNMACFPDGAGG
jgi:hypothetical protein